MTNTYSEASVLAFHGFNVVGKTAADVARDHGVLRACLGCGSIAVAPEGFSTEDYHAAQPWARAAMESDAWDCCPDADSIFY